MKVENQIWTEKYRPQTLDEVVGQRHVVDRLKSWIKSRNLPNMLFAGPAGVGKTTIALCVAKDLFGNHWRENFQETNASDDRGINVVRGRIKDFAKTKPIGSDFKIIFLDESDALTPEAQQALRRTIERYSNVCRFILSCNYSSRLIEPIQSRMAVFRFKNLGREEITKYVKRVSDGEKLVIADGGIEAVYDTCEGDLRRATNIMQSASAIGKISPENIYDVSSQVKPKEIQEMVSNAMNGKFIESRKILYNLLFEQGLSSEDIIKSIHREVYDMEIPEEIKMRIIERLGEYEYRLNMGANEDVQLNALLAQFALMRKE